MFRFTSKLRSAAMLATTILITMTGCAGLVGQANPQQVEVPEASSPQQYVPSPATRRAYGVAQATRLCCAEKHWRYDAPCRRHDEHAGTGRDAGTAEL